MNEELQQKQIQRLFDAIGLSPTEPDYSAIDELAGAVNDMQGQLNTLAKDTLARYDWHSEAIGGNAAKIKRLEEQVGKLLLHERDQMKCDETSYDELSKRIEALEPGIDRIQFIKEHMIEATRGNDAWWLDTWVEDAFESAEEAWEKRNE